MKKIIIIFITLIICCMLGCSKKNENGSTIVNNANVEYEVVNLTLSNYKDFITIYEDVKVGDTSSGSRVYYNIYGAEGCRFEDCVITYEGYINGSLKLSISGNGQIILNRTTKGTINITGISGKVKYPNI